MHPDNHTPQKPLYVPPRQVAPTPGRPHQPAHSAVADIARSQIDRIYANDPQANMPASDSEQPEEASSPPASHPARPQAARTDFPSISHTFTQQAPEPANPYQRTHDESQLHANTDSWKQYHSAWQSYYQQYFHRYYSGHIQATQSKLAEQQAQIETLKQRPVEQTPEEALSDLRSQVRHKVRETTKKVRKSRHFVPVLAGCIVMLVFAFLQYNAILFANVEAYVSPASSEPGNIIVNPTSTVAPDDKPRLLIPKIAVDVPIIWNVTPVYESQMTAMKKGVAWFNIRGANAKPGQVGNTVLSGHSSNDVFDDGEYKFVFARLEQLSKGDTIYVNNDSVRYTYTVTQIRTVKPTQVNALTEPTTKPIITLITCTPLGTATNRLLVTAEQVSPSPAGAAKAAEGSASDDAAMPGNAPTFFERLFGGR